MQHLQEVIEIFSDFQPVFVDDQAEKLGAIKTQYQYAVTVLVSQDQNKNNDIQKLPYQADISIESLEELLEYVFE